MEKNLPRELVVEILLRLPVKPLVRFKCVGKSWLALISDPRFAKSHFERDAAPSHRLLYLRNYGTEALSIDVDASLQDDSTAVALIPRPLMSWPRTTKSGVQIFGSCRGQLSYSDVGQQLFDSYEFTLLFGLGYDASTDDYLVVVTWAEYRRPRVDRAIRVVLFSVRTNSWKEIQGAPIPYMYNPYQAGLLFNGAIHWLAFRQYVVNDVNLVFDLIEKNLSEISLPDGNFTDGTFYNLRIVGGCLSVSYLRETSTEMWVMKEYNVQSSWTKFEIPTMYIFPVCFAKGGELVTTSYGGIMKFNDNGQLLERRKYYDDSKRCKAAISKPEQLRISEMQTPGTKERCFRIRHDKDIKLGKLYNIEQEQLGMNLLQWVLSI
ncbi:hypothetical protein VNO77_21415 [Canavalia gladiata]|uniref:F-box domain-containing protein n=1 Tax=Canavalia gladiata TaxID=3824 RepID=A0AAN9LR06_CANGL